MSNEILYKNLIASMNNPEAARAWRASILYYDAMIKNYSMGLKYWSDRNHFADFINVRYEEESKFFDKLQTITFVFAAIQLIIVWMAFLSSLH